MVRSLEQIFPALRHGGYRVTSPVDKCYNCIGYAAGDTANWWWPAPQIKDVFWPAGVPREETIAAFAHAFRSLGFVECNTEEFEAGVDRIALFADEQGRPLHAARQMTSARWTSKLGEREDVEHSLRDLEGDVYGKVVLIMKRATD
jgi:hypothetical protein